MQLPAPSDTVLRLVIQLPDISAASLTENTPYFERHRDHILLEIEVGSKSATRWCIINRT